MKLFAASLVLVTIVLVLPSDAQSPSAAMPPSPPAHITKTPSDPKTSLPQEGLVPDKETAVKIAEAVLFRLYGQDAIVAQRPYTIREENFIWWISGNIPGEKLGFTFKIAISKQTGAVLHLSLY